MEIHLYPFQNISLLLVITTTICLFHVRKSSAADYDRYLNCSASFQCVNFRDVHYPFWGSSRPDYCGYPDFKLNCSGDAPVISFDGQDYRVLDINQSTSTLRVARTDFWNNLCPVSLANTTIKSSRVKNTSDVQEVLLFYNCPPLDVPLPIQPTSQFSCSINSTATSNNYFITNLELPNISGNCKTTVTASISQSAAANLVLNSSKDNLVAALDSGIGLKWDASNTLCDQCRGSGGQCGYNISSAEFTCFCKDGHTPSNCEGKGKPIKLIVSLTVVCFIGVLGAIVFGLCRMRAKQKGHIKLTRKHPKITRGTLQEYIGGKHDLSELLIYDFDSILVATDNFSIENKIGQGGFGPVYWGKLAEGKEIAVKRLSSTSGQGVVEFKNEMLLISNLQHKNLVRIMGCCVKEDEKLLIYEFMPNKSLDTFLFDSTRRAVLDWGTRFNIIQGVAKGLVYLHHDSYLKVIHRDLKVSNILLDEKMNPKISDFGLARSIEGTQNLENTQRVAGTRGYMSPEYAMGGIFSQKSDVYSFGVLVLEIISSKKNTAFYIYDRQLGLLAYAWQLWKEGRELELVVEMLAADSYSASEVMKCVHIGLLCVQDNAMDRPSMPDVVFMLNGSTTIIGGAQPKQPLFTIQNTVSHPQPQPSNTFLTNEATMTLIEGR